MNDYCAVGTSSPNFSVRLLGTDDVVVAEAEIVLDGGYEYYAARSSSRRDPSDAPNSEIGTKLAIGRAVRQLGREILKDGQSLVREQERARRKQAEAAEKAKDKKANKPRVCSCGDLDCSYDFDGV